MRLFSIYPFFMILLSLFLFACDVHEWPDETSEPPKPDHVSVELRLDFTSDRAELPDYESVAEHDKSCGFIVCNQLSYKTF